MNSGFEKIIANNPDDDVSKLAYRDWLEENGHPERAELIDIGFKLESCGLPHRQVGFGKDDEYVLFGAGPDYWQFGEGGDYFEVGERIDIRYDNGRGFKIKRGVLITKVADGDVTIKKDTLSGPWKGENLLKRHNELILRSWMYPVAECSPIWKKGFISEISIDLGNVTESWLRGVVRMHPITAIHVKDATPTLVNHGQYERNFFWLMRDWGFLGNYMPNNKVVSEYYVSQKEAKIKLARALASWARATQ